MMVDLEIYFLTTEQLTIIIRRYHVCLMVYLHNFQRCVAGAHDEEICGSKR